MSRLRSWSSTIRIQVTPTLPATTAPNPRLAGGKLRDDRTVNPSFILSLSYAPLRKTWSTGASTGSKMTLQRYAGPELGELRFCREILDVSPYAGLNLLVRK